MKNLLILLFLWFSLTISGATYYVSPSGSDSNPGTNAQPFFTLNKAWTVVSAGDIIYMRGGTYNYASQQLLSGKSGTSGSYITISAYSTEKPVMDFTGNGDMSMKSGLRLDNINYVYFKGLRITNVTQPTNPQNGVYGVLLRANVNHCTFEQIESDHVGGWGFSMFDNCSDLLFLNCDSHHNSDPYSATQSGGGDNYGGSDGWQCGTQTVTNVTFTGCRAYANSDDGWDLRMSVGDYTFNNCWSFWNGYIPETITTPSNRSSWVHGGNGEAMKVGGNGGHRIIRNCLMFENYLGGIQNSDDEGGYVTQEVYNTIAYKSQMGFNYQYNHPATLRNNISYSNDNNWQTGTGVTDDHNSWNGGIVVTDADFQSVSSVGMDGPRQADGSLPVLNFLKLVNGSSLIDAGADVGLPYSGKAPDIGAFESQSGSTTVAIPAFTTASVENATPSLLELTYNLTLANIVPAASSFSVLVNSVARTVNTVAISGSKVQLTFTSAIKFGDIVTVSYTKPASNPIQTSSGGQAITIGAQTVTNKVIAVNPVYISSVVENATPSLLEMTYDLSLNNLIVPASSSFSVIVNSMARTVSTVAVSGTRVQLTLSSPIAYSDLVTVSYTKPSSSPLQTTAGGQAITTGIKTVTNDISSPGPVYVSSAVANVTPSLLEMTYNMTLAGTAPAPSSFSVLVNSVARTVSSVVISGTKVQLTLATRIVPGDLVTVSYTKPTSNPIQTTTGGTAGNISNLQVINNCINTAPTAVITSPTMGSSFTASANIIISATALDSDGSVSLVEFYNGNSRLGSKSSAPYSLTWNNVSAGTYSLTVVATDNLSAKTTSSPVSISVINGTPAVNQHPVVKISNPSKGNKFEGLSTVTIGAIASDPDGFISKVEFYSGSVKLVELTLAPYTYIWKDVPAGSYSITAVATDNLNDTTISSPVKFEVGSTVKYDVNSEIIKLYPNPNNGHFSIKFINPLQDEKSEIIITDMTGKQVYNSPVLKEETLKQIDVSGSRSGIYVMMIKDKEILVTKKFIKD